jgi:hypothetical protein
MAGTRLARSTRNANTLAAFWRSASTIVLPEKPVLNLSVDSVKPLLCAFRPFPIHTDLSLKFADPIFGRSKLMGNLLGPVDSMLTICFDNTSCSVKHFQYHLARFIELTDPISTRAPRGCWCELND